MPYPTGLPGISWPQPATWQKVPARKRYPNYHQHNSYQPIVYIGNSINEMHTYQHGRAQQHDRCGLAPLVNETTKDRSQNQRSQCRKSGKCTGHILIDTVFDNHQLGSKLLEWEYTRVEQYTQQCYQPETGIDQNILHILKENFSSSSSVPAAMAAASICLSSFLSITAK